MNEQELTETIMEMIPTMVALSVGMKIAIDAYNENPQMFWSYLYQKNKQFIYNCRM